jgi:hypothetical protein
MERLDYLCKRFSVAASELVMVEALELDCIVLQYPLSNMKVSIILRVDCL